jgi:hypothetical protein
MANIVQAPSPRWTQIVQRYIAALDAEGWEPPFASGPDSSEDVE